ncbi:alpha/beta hydrolase [Streptomyces sp. N50]|uniref:alpha/beta hydrolase n=1 Tax=Streptomyces sp. N50 TaxID=3081765 RepID=UPI0029620E22|nr:alpha/beta hydrolase [Streptomyces sp. N50]WOX16487.1 alpha/beta hydrolase [Streptomyces sp. N50]
MEPEIPSVPKLPVPAASTIAPPDLADSTLLNVGASPQMTLGTVEIESHPDVTFSGVGLPNGESRDLKADVLRPATGDRLPLVLFLPGGAFLRCNKAMAFDVRRHVAESGFVVASVEYRVAPDGGTYLDSVHDVRAALAHLRQHADDFGIDPRAVALWGESAGGHVAALTGVTNDLPEFSGDSGPSSTGAAQAVVDAFGTSLFSAIADDFDEAARLHYERTATHFSAYVGKAGALFSDIPEAVRAADPATYVTASAPPFLLLHGSDDMLVSSSQTQHVHQALLAAGADSTRYVVAGAHHGDLGVLPDSDAALAWSSATVMDIVTAFLHRHLDSPDLPK